MEDKIQQVAKNIKSTRESKNYSADYMSEMLNIPLKEYLKYEKYGALGGKKPSFEIFVKIAKILKVSTDFLLGLKD